MNLSKAKCANCEKQMSVERMHCVDCGVSLEGQFDIPPLATLSQDDQIFVTAFVRYHGSIKKMEELFEISYPTVKNRLNAIGSQLDKSYQAPSANAVVLEMLSRGELSVEEALERMR